MCVCVEISLCVCHGRNVQSARKQWQACLSPFPDQCFNTCSLSGYISVDLATWRLAPCSTAKNMILEQQHSNVSNERWHDAASLLRFYSIVMRRVKNLAEAWKIDAHASDLHERLRLHCYCTAVKNSHFKPQSGPQSTSALCRRQLFSQLQRRATAKASSRKRHEADFQDINKSVEKYVHIFGLDSSWQGISQVEMSENMTSTNNGGVFGGQATLFPK